MTSVSLARAVLPVALSSCAALAGGCRTAGVTAAPGAEAPVAMGGPATRAEHRLGNGVRVVIEENHAAPAVAVQVWVAGGAAGDPPALAGSAHFFEHLVLRGTKRRSPGTAAREIEALGGTLGAWTGVDETVYHASVAAPFLDTALDVLGDALANPSFEPAEVERARRLIADELAVAHADGARRASEALLATAFAGQPYARPLLGTEAAVAARTRAELVARFAESYVGGAMTVVVVGDVDAARARAAVGAAFAAVARGARPGEAAPGAGPAPAASRVAFATGPRALDEAELVLGFRTPVEGPGEAAALDLAAAVLARGDGARLGRALVRNRQLARSVRGTTFCSRGGGLVALAVTPSTRRLDEVAERAVDLALGLAREEVPPAELAEARAAVEGDLGRGEAGIEGRARRLGFAAAVAGDLAWESRYRERLRAIDGAELRAAAEKVFRADTLALAVVVPEGGAPGETEGRLRPRLEAAIAGAEARADRAVRAAAAARIGAGDVARFAAPAGPRLLVLRDASAPLITVEAGWAGGAGADDRAAPLIAALLDRGSRTRSAADITAEMRGIGGAIEGFADGAALGLRADFVAAGLERGIALVADCLLHPSFPEAALDGERRALLARAGAEGRGPDGGARAALQLFEETVVPGRRAADAEALSALTRVRLLEGYRRRYSLAGLVVAVIGDVDPQRVTDAFAASFADAPASPPRPSASPPPPPPRLEPATVFRATAGPDADVVVGYPTFAPADPDRLPLELLAEILAGDGGRLAGLLRDARTPATRLAGRAAGVAEPGYLAVTLTCAPAHLDAVVAAVRTAFAAVVAGGVTADEVNRAARRMLGARAAALRSGAAIAHALVLDEARGLPPLSYRRDAASISRLAPDDVARAARRALDPRREVIAVVGGVGHAPRAVAGGER